MRTTTSIPRIYADQNGLKHHELTKKLIGIFYAIYNELGHGFLESIYEQAFSVALAEREIFFQRQIWQCVPPRLRSECCSILGRARNSSATPRSRMKEKIRDNPRESAEEK